MEHCVAASATRDRVGLSAFDDDGIKNSTADAVRERVDFAADPSLPYDSHEATVRVVTADGKVRERVQPDPPGVHVDPPSGAKLREKYLECATQALEESATKQLTTGWRRWQKSRP